MTKTEQYLQKQSRLDELAYKEWTEFSKKHPDQSHPDYLSDIDMLVSIQKSREEKLLNSMIWMRNIVFK
jgi:hypothetical protein